MNDTAPLDREARLALAGHSVTRLTDAVDGMLGERLRLAPGTKLDPFADDVVTLDTFGLLERCARRAARPAADYADTVRTVRRRLGLLCLRRLGELPEPAPGVPQPFVASVLDDVMSDPDGWPRRLRDWVDGLDRAGRSAVVAGAATWCHGALRLVGDSPRIVWADPGGAPRWNVPDRLVTMTSPMDATFRSGDGERLLLIADGDDGPSDRLRAGHLALVRSVGRRMAPISVTLGSPSRGTLERTDVDTALLDLAVDRAVELLAHRAEPHRAGTTPGRGCSHCHLLDQCDAGSEHVATLLG